MLPETQFLVRAFPSPNKDWNNVKLDANQKSIYLRSLEDLRRGKLGSNIFWQFKVDGIFVNVSQEEFYRAVVSKELLQKVLEGNDVMIFCFGSSTTGKSYSAFGMYNRVEYRGIAPRLLEDIFKLKDENTTSCKTDISLAYVEIIGKNIHNLLLKGKPIILKKGKKSYHGFGTRLETICQGMKLIFDGDERRNFEKETSHCGTSILTFDMTCTSLITSNPSNCVGRIHLIDTAGTDYGNSLTKSLKCHIDANLTKCELNTICSWYNASFNSTKTFFPRSSTLALYLGTTITNGYRRLLAHIKTTSDDLPNTMSTLLFGTRLSKLHSPLLVQARTKNMDLLIKGLQDEIREIKDNIVADKLVKGVFMPDTLSQDHMEYLMREIKVFCQSSSYPPGILLAKAHPLILLVGFREIYNRDIEDVKEFFLAEIETKEREQDKSRAKRPSSSLTSVQIKKASPNKGSLQATSINLSKAVQDASKMPEEYSKVDMDSEATGEDNYAKTMSEYMSKSSAIKSKIKLYEIDIEEYYKNKCELQSKLTEVKEKIESLRLDLEKEEWNTFHKMLETNFYNKDGKQASKSQEQEKLESEIEAEVDLFNETRSTLYLIHNKYILTKAMLNEMKINIEKDYNEYVKLMLSNTLLLPPEEVSSRKQPQNESESPLKEKPIDRSMEAEMCFTKLQRKPLQNK